MSIASKVASWGGHSVRVSAIESELSRIWKRAELQPGGRHADVRTSVLNLIVYADQEDAEVAASAIRPLSAMHPLRVLLVIARPNARQSRLDASIDVYCHPTYSLYKQTCAEQITIHAYGKVAAHLSSVVAPLLVPDLPVFLWQPGAPALGHDFVSRLLDGCDRLIIDGARALSLGPLGRCAVLTRGSGPAVSDFAWSRMECWREFAAQLFDVPGAADHYPALASIRISHPQDRAWEAHLFAAWLVDRLGLRPISDDGAPAARQPADIRLPRLGSRLLLRNLGGGEVTLELSASSIPEGCHSPLAGITIEARGANFSLALSDDGEHVESSGTLGGQALRRRLPLEPRETAELLGDGLREFGHDPLYERALSLALDLAAIAG